MPPRTRKIGAIDVHTGEVLDGVPVLIPSRQPSPYGEQWMQLHQAPLIEIACDKEITLQHHRILMYLNAILDFDNWIYTQPTEIGRVLGIHRSNVRAVLRLLEEKQIIIPGPRIGNTPTYRLNPLFGWKGKVVQLRQELTPADMARFHTQKEVKKT